MTKETLKALKVGYGVSLGILALVLLVSKIAFGQFDALPPEMGGSGTNTVPLNGQLLVGNASGTYNVTTTIPGSITISTATISGLLTARLNQLTTTSTPTSTLTLVASGTGQAIICST